MGESRTSRRPLKVDSRTLVPVRDGHFVLHIRIEAREIGGYEISLKYRLNSLRGGCTRA